LPDGHPANKCWWCYADRDSDDDDSHTEDKAACHVDTNWYVDSGATDHITTQLNKMHTRDTYKGRDQVHDASGSGMTTAHVGHSLLHTPHHPLHLRNILRVPSASKNLLSAHKIALHNDAFIEFHPSFFLIKDQATKRTLFRGPCHGNLYPLIPTAAKNSKNAFITIKQFRPSIVFYCSISS
jgi:hypothetical protein